MANTASAGKRAEAIQQQRAGEKPPRRVFVAPPMLIMASYGVAFVAVTAAIGATIVSVISIISPRLIENQLGLNAEYESNLSTGVLFFWIEIAVVVVGLRLLDQNANRANKRRNIDAIFQRMVQVEEEIDNIRYAFALSLDRGVVRGAYYDANLSYLNQKLGDVRLSMTAFMLKLEGFGQTEAKIFDRIVRAFDLMMEESYHRTENVEFHTRKIKEALSQLPENAPLTDTLRGLKTELDEALDKLIESSNTSTMGLQAIIQVLPSLLREDKERDA